ncbi:phosphodiester glycosidase family protein [Mucilaginibacter sp.]|uniref:phosphodiester glycosidase family protein n=1 Tax=Mucilaginibacter sp. TaxID=1882438 RepID=UPI0025D279D8|nr:phosphodiester glycosidase family protein [Mucilaginibacter sp.]
MKAAGYIFVMLLCLASISYYSQTDTQALDKMGLFKQITFLGKRYFVFEADPHQYKVELFNQVQNNGQLYSFTSIAAIKGNSLVFVTNGGMYEKDFSPVGLYVSNGKTYNPVNSRQGGTGNFYQLKPNGVFMINSKGDAQVLTTENYVKNNPEPNMATQSGPMLLINGVTNSNFKEHSENINIRNGVGINAKSNVVFAISIDQVNFYELAELFKEKLGCENALYLDGFVSQYFAPGIQKAPLPGVQLGTFISVSKKMK